jgi:transposase-like protein
MVLTERCEKHFAGDALFHVDSAPWLQAALHRHSLNYRHENVVLGIASNVFFEN